MKKHKCSKRDGETNYYSAVRAYSAREVFACVYSFIQVCSFIYIYPTIFRKGIKLAYRKSKIAYVKMRMRD